MTPLRNFMLCLTVCLFSIPALAQEGHIGFFSTQQSEAAAQPKKEDNAPLGADFSELRSMGLVTVDQIIDPLRVRLLDGRIVQLTGIDIPDFNPANPGEISAQAIDALRLMLEKKEATLYQTKDDGEGRRNRMGHHLGHLETRGDKTWIQGTLIANGLARILPAAKHTEMAAQMLKAEEEARKETAGLWKETAFAVLTPETAGTAMNNWAVVEGKISKTGASNNVVFLNFGDDWRKDFTIGIEGEVRRQLSKNNIAPIEMAGKRVRIHGWVEDYNGPYIKLSNAVWLEVLPDKEPLPDKDTKANLPADN